MAEFLTQLSQFVDSQIWSKTMDLTKQANQAIRKLHPTSGISTFRQIISSRQNRKFFSKMQKPSLGPVFAKSKVTEELTEKQDVEYEGDRFQNTLNEINELELTTKLQTPRLYNNCSQKLTAGLIEENRAVPEKYKFLPFLVKKGIGTEEIAEAMSISQFEAQQLVTLAKISMRK